MKNVAIAITILGLAVTSASPAFAIKQLNDQFKKVYAGDDANAEFKDLVTAAKCNVCHISKTSKKKRNVYGKALHEALEVAEKAGEFDLKEFKKDQDKYAKKLKEIFGAVAKAESGDSEHKTFADRMKANLLPGGDKDGK